VTDDQYDDILSKAMPPSTDSPQEDDASLQDVANLLWEANQSAPPLREDPIAAMLGLVPDPAYALDSSKLKQARKQAGLQISDLVSRLSARGWTVDRADLFRWENQSANDVSPALIKALSEEMRTGSDQLTTKQPRAIPAAVEHVLNSPVFAGLVERWAKAQNVSRSLATSQLESRMLATVYRGSNAGADQMLRSLEALLIATENPEKPAREH